MKVHFIIKLVKNLKEYLLHLIQTTEFSEFCIDILFIYILSKNLQNKVSNCIKKCQYNWPQIGHIVPKTVVSLSILGSKNNRKSILKDKFIKTSTMFLEPLYLFGLRQKHPFSHPFMDWKCASMHSARNFFDSPNRLWEALTALEFYLVLHRAPMFSFFFRPSNNLASSYTLTIDSNMKMHLWNSAHTI